MVGVGPEGRLQPSQGRATTDWTDLVTTVGGCSPEVGPAPKRAYAVS